MSIILESSIVPLFPGRWHPGRQPPICFLDPRITLPVLELDTNGFLWRVCSWLLSLNIKLMQLPESDQPCLLPRVIRVMSTPQFVPPLSC